MKNVQVYFAFSIHQCLKLVFIILQISREISFEISIRVFLPSVEIHVFAQSLRVDRDWFCLPFHLHLQIPVGGLHLLSLILGTTTRFSIIRGIGLTVTISSTCTCCCSFTTTFRRVLSSSSRPRNLLSRLRRSLGFFCFLSLLFCVSVCFVSAPYS